MLAGKWNLSSGFHTELKHEIYMHNKLKIKFSTYKQIFIHEVKILLFISQL